MIADHPEQLTSRLTGDLVRGHRTFRYHVFSYAEVHSRIPEPDAPLRAAFGGGRFRFGAAAFATPRGAPR